MELPEHLHTQSYRSGNDVWKVARLIKLSEGLEPFSLPFKHFNTNGLHPEIDSMQDYLYQMRCVEKSDLDCPIILNEEGEVMDGRHRVAKAMLLGKHSILAVRFTKTPECCFIQEVG